MDPKIILTGSLYTINLPWVLWFWSAACKSVGRLGFGLGPGVDSLWWCLLWSQATSSLPVLGFVYNLPSLSSSTSLSSGHGVSTYNTKAYWQEKTSISQCKQCKQFWKPDICLREAVDKQLPQDDEVFIMLISVHVSERHLKTPASRWWCSRCSCPQCQRWTILIS